MKNYLFIFSVALLSYSCSLSKSVSKNQNSIEARVVYSKNNDTIIVKQDSLHIQFNTKNYIREYENFHTKDNRGQILMSIENSIRLSPETLKMIEADGTATMKSILSKNNWDKFIRRIPITLNVILSLDNLSISEYNISIYIKNVKDLSLSNGEIEKLFDYCKKMQFIYTGNEFKNKEIQVPVGWIFAIKKE